MRNKCEVCGEPDTGYMPHGALCLVHFKDWREWYLRQYPEAERRLLNIGIWRQRFEEYCRMAVERLRQEVLV